MPNRPDHARPEFIELFDDLGQSGVFRVLHVFTIGHGTYAAFGAQQQIGSIAPDEVLIRRIELDDKGYELYVPPSPEELDDISAIVAKHLAKMTVRSKTNAEDRRSHDQAENRKRLSDH